MKGEKFVTFILTLVVLAMVGLVVVQNTIGLDALLGKAQEGSGTEMKPKSSAPSVTNVEVIPASRSVFIKTINVNGELAIKDSGKNVPADTSGKITEVLIERGDHVEAGQVIAKADPSTPGSQYKVRNIVSTVSGTVLSVDAYVGQNVSSTTTVASVGNPSDLILKLNVPEKYLSTFSLGSEAYFTTAAWPEKEFAATVSFIGNSVSTATRTVEVELTINEKDDRLMEGMFVKTRLVVEKQEDVFTVPTQSISTYLSDAVVYVVNSDNKAERKVVTTGHYNDFETIIVLGLEEGERIITVGSVTDGTPVNIVK